MILPQYFKFPRVGVLQRITAHVIMYVIAAYTVSQESTIFVCFYFLFDFLDQNQPFLFLVSGLMPFLKIETLCILFLQ